MGKQQIPVGQLIRLITKVLRYRKDGWTNAEKQALVVDLLSLAGDIADEFDADT